ncbi:uncharacterized protein BP5553_08179 [Venustampulla echinocandica]|uniref:SH3 domain-containing protein n=1 Tax=Venustampulla echinocandica TaxID=2656787 RepID=A0A370TG03_9HELO|nr:uncharacterized protein BP5553_08179 [Venustampulla echinocandica]RDL33811.1 hypothetical protein BP5553_08179 [Venustampulla echinocandica]
MASHDHVRHRHRRAALPEPVPEPAPMPAPEVSIVYVTASATFDGPIAGYSTVGAPPPKTEKPKPTPTPAPKPSPADEESDTSVAPKPKQTPVSDDDAKATSKKTKASSSMPTAITAPSTLAVSSAPILVATSSIAPLSEPTLDAQSSASATAVPANKSAEGMSAGGKAGLAIGILALVAAILCLVLYCFKRRKDAAAKLSDGEKQSDPFADVPARQASTRTNPNAPRLSLRPVTQFIPILEKRSSRGNALQAASAAPAMSEKRTPVGGPAPGQSDNRSNPFGNHAETIDSTNANGPAVVQGTTPSGMAVTAAGAVAAAGVATGAAVGLKRGASKRENGPKPMDFTRSGPFMGPPSPAGTEFSTSSDSPSTPTQTNTSAAIAAAGGPANTAVHRVQLDFKPSMDDELELSAGQLIRVLHEYDDGWALCIRLDRSRQGVVPRTCLSTRPVKPRPQQNGPRGPPGRPMGPPGMNQGRPMSPSGRPPMNLPNGPPSGRPNSPSNAQMQARRNSPPGPGPSPMNSTIQPNGSGSSPPMGGAPARKPVPGQAY